LNFEISESQNQTWQVQKKTCQVKTKVKIKFGRCPDLPGFVLTWQVWIRKLNFPNNP
jgi:hypothetical protein